MPITTGIRQLKNRLSHYLRRVREGETVIITDRGQPIAHIIPFEQTTVERLEQLQAGGLIAWSGEQLGAQAPVPKVQGARTVADLLLEDRH